MGKEFIHGVMVESTEASFKMVVKLRRAIEPPLKLRMNFLILVSRVFHKETGL